MSLVGKVGRRRIRARFAMAVLYTLLCLGAVTTLYPFALMISTGLKGAFDQNDNRLVPGYLTNDETLFSKYVDDKYASNMSLIASTRIGDRVDLKAVRRYETFLSQLPLDDWIAGFGMASSQVTCRLRSRYQSWLRRRYGSIDALDRAYGEENVAFQTVDPPNELLERKAWSAGNDTKSREWREFKSGLPPEFRIPVRVTRIYQEWIRGRYRNRFSDVPQSLASSATSFEALQLPAGGPVLSDFRANALPQRYARQDSESLWASFTGSGHEPMPVVAYERQCLVVSLESVRGEFAGRNFAYVLDYILINGRAVWNTLVFCLLAIGTQLLVNPLAAYALSRYPIRASGQILIFLLATMAFPAEVAMIPSFLLLKDLGLLNTFAALVLPGAASGYMIFLLKGFFDSLPQELFEAGQLDGAPESTMMFRIALPLSRPVLGYLALLAFMGAYGAFIYAFLVAQDQRIWTLMVWVYQLQTSAPKTVMMAALSLVALPTLLVFLFAQRTIMRGIVLPGER